MKKKKGTKPEKPLSKSVAALAKSPDDYVDESYANRFNSFVHDVRETVISKGFHESPEYETVPHFCMMVITELAEIVEYDRTDSFKEPCDKKFGKVPIGISKIEEEVADAMMRLMSFAEKHGLNLGRAIQLKHLFNTMRPRKHGKKY